LDLNGIVLGWNMPIVATNRSGPAKPMKNEARERLAMTDAEVVAHFARFGYRVSIAQIAFTSEPVEDFREARSRRWFRAGVIRNNEPGLLIIEEAQPRGGQRTRDIVVVSLGATRCVMGIEIKPGAPPLRSGDTVHPYAKTMEWSMADAKAPAKPAVKAARRA
jgi:hypothetical protein